MSYLWFLHQFISIMPLVFLFKYHWVAFSRTWQLSLTITLGLVQAWTRTCSGYTVLQLGLAWWHQPFKYVVRFFCRVLLLFLMGVEDAKIKLPMDGMIQVFYKEIIWPKNPVSLGWCATSHSYHFWSHSNYDDNLFLFTLDGCMCRFAWIYTSYNYDIKQQNLW